VYFVGIQKNRRSKERTKQAKLYIRRKEKRCRRRRRRKKNENTYLT
jgi:hypothetical protein